MHSPLPLSALTLTCLAFLFAACSSKSLADETLTTMEKFVTTLEGVKDEASAKAAVPVLEPIVARMKELGEQVEKLPADEKAKMEAEGKERGDALGARMLKAMSVMQDPKVAAIIGPVMEKMK